MECSSCGAVLRTGAAYCSDCGTRQVALPVGETTGQPTVGLLPPLPPPPPPLPPQSIAAQPRREDKAPDRVCVRVGCPVRGMATFDEHCPSCQFATQPYRDVAAEAGPAPAPAQPWTPGRTNFDQPQPPIPAITTTVVITGLFGLFGLIPATMHTNRARDVGVRTGKYWNAFGWTMGISVGAWIALFAVLAAAASSASSSISSSVGGFAARDTALPASAAPLADTSTSDSAPVPQTPAQVFVAEVNSEYLFNPYSDEQLLTLARYACSDNALGAPQNAEYDFAVSHPDVSSVAVIYIVESAVDSGLCGG